LTFEEEDRLLGALPERATVVVQLGLECGARIQSELLGLRWPDVDLDRQQLHITAVHSKNGKGRVLPLSDGMTATLRTMQATATSDLVFPGRGGRFYHRFKADYFAALHKAKLAGLGIGVHTCRHSWASRMIEAGADLVTLRDLGGWSDLSLVSRYSHFRPQRGVDATAAMLALRDAARRPALAVGGSTSTSR
jgi:integrase